jgi:hypothetical protein
LAGTPRRIKKLGFVDARVIMDQISFANGIVLSPDEDFILVGEIGRFNWTILI